MNHGNFRSKTLSFYFQNQIKTLNSMLLWPKDRTTKNNRFIKLISWTEHEMKELKHETYTWSKCTASKWCGFHGLVTRALWKLMVWLFTSPLRLSNMAKCYRTDPLNHHSIQTDSNNKKCIQINTFKYKPITPMTPIHKKCQQQKKKLG